MMHRMNSNVDINNDIFNDIDDRGNCINDIDDVDIF